MKLAELSVRRSVTFSMVYLIVVGFGLFSLFRLKLDMYPDITYPRMGIVVIYEGSSPQDVEQLVTRIVEEAVSSVEGVKRIDSISKYGASITFVEFNWGTDMDQAETDVRRALDLFSDFFPEDAEEPIVFPFDPSMQPILFFAVSGPYDQEKMREISKHQIEPLFERIEGVASAETIGGLKREIQVLFDPYKLAYYGISPLQIVSALRRENLQLPSGDIIEGDRRITILTHGEFRNVKEIENIPIAYKKGVPIKIGDVAKVLDTYHEKTRIVRANYRPAVVLLIRKQSGANTVQVIKRVRKELPKIVKSLPEGIRLKVIFDQADFIERSLGNLGNNAILAIIITFFVLLFFLQNIRASLIVSTAIPVSIILTFGVMDQMGVTLNIISMAGLALAVGMLVDNAIVVLENIYRVYEESGDIITASIKGSKEVGLAITSSTLTTIAVFFPILFVPGIAGAMFRDMALTICFSLSVSLIVALSLIPLLSSKVLKREGRERLSLGHRIVFSILIFPWLIYLFFKITAPIRNFLANFTKGIIKKLTKGYDRLLCFSFGFPKTTLFIAYLILAFSILLLIKTPTNFFPKQDDSLMLFKVRGSVGTNIMKMDRYFRKVEKIIKKEVPEAELVCSDFGQGEGFLAMFREGEHSGILRIRLVPLSKRERREEDIAKVLREKINKIPGIEFSIFEPFSFTGEYDIEVDIFGHDLVLAKKIGYELMDRLKKIKGIGDIEFSLEKEKSEFQIYPDRRKLKELGIDIYTLISTISCYFKGRRAGIYREGGYDYDIIVRAEDRFRKDRDKIERMPLVLPMSGKSIPLSSVAEIKEELTPLAITRRDQRRMVSLNINSETKDLGWLIKRVESVIEEYKKELYKDPKGREFTFHIGGTAEDFKESFFYLGIALVVAGILVYMVMASQFESLLEPFIIFLTLMFLPIGVGFSLYLTKTPISVVSLIGVILLVGIAVNNSIVLVDTANRIKESYNLSAEEAIKRAASMRFRPILMTASTTILAMVPLAIELGEGAEGWSPMAKVVIGGLLGTTLATLFIVPLYYKFILRLVGILKR